MNIIGCIFKQFEYFGSEIWTVKMDYWILTNKNVFEMFWTEISKLKYATISANTKSNP